MLGPRNIHILLIYGIKNGVHVVECYLYTIFRVSGILRHFWCSYARANSITPSDLNTPSRTLYLKAQRRTSNSLRAMRANGPHQNSPKIRKSILLYLNDHLIINSNNLDLDFYIYSIASIKVNSIVVFKILKFRGRNDAKLLYLKNY
jgi:hypothetical protein